MRYFVSHQHHHQSLLYGLCSSSCCCCCYCCDFIAPASATTTTSTPPTLQLASYATSPVKRKLTEWKPWIELLASSDQMIITLHGSSQIPIAANSLANLLCLVLISTKYPRPLVWAPKLGLETGGAFSFPRLHESQWVSYGLTVAKHRIFAGVVQRVVSAKATDDIAMGPIGYYMNMYSCGAK